MKLYICDICGKIRPFIINKDYVDYCRECYYELLKFTSDKNGGTSNEMQGSQPVQGEKM